MMTGVVAAPLRRVEALAYIMERIQRSGISPSYGEIAAALRPRVDPSRARQLVDQLVSHGFIERSPASRRGIMIRDVARCREAIDAELGHGGWRHAAPMGDLQQPSTFEQLPRVPPFEHIPDVD